MQSRSGKNTLKCGLYADTELASHAVVFRGVVLLKTTAWEANTELAEFDFVLLSIKEQGCLLPAHYVRAHVPSKFGLKPSMRIDSHDMSNVKFPQDRKNLRQEKKLTRQDPSQKLKKGKRRV